MAALHLGGFDILTLITDSVHLKAWCNKEMLLSTSVSITTMNEQTTTLTDQTIFKKYELRQVTSTILIRHCKHIHY